MPRTFSSTIAGELAKRLGTEPLVIVEIDWTGEKFVAYSDRKLNGASYPYPFIVDMGSFDTTVIVDGSGDSQNVAITLSDVDGSIREIINKHDIHLRPVKVYLGFQGLPVDAKALMFEGLINSPIVWDETSRTLRFDVFSKLEDAEVGFTMEDGDFAHVPPADRNKAWPLVFGQVCNMKAVPVTSTRKGFLGAGQGVADPTIAERLCQACFLLCPEAQSSSANSLIDSSIANSVTLPGFESGEGEQAENIVSEGEFSGAFGSDSSQRADQNCLTRRFNEVCAIITERDQQLEHVKPTLTVRGGNDFPQNETIRIRVGDVEYEGTMVGETFTISQTFHPALEDIDNPPCRVVKDSSNGSRVLAGPGDKPTTLSECNNGGTNRTIDLVDGAGASWEYYNTFEKADFIWLPPGTEVFLAEESEIVNIVSLIPGVVDQVAAYRTYGDTSLLSEVDPERYTVVTTDFGGYDVVEVRLKRALSLIPDEDWEDDIYVSFTSDVGPNPVDIIEWLVGQYTNYSIDTASFNSVRTDLTNYPSNFALKQRRSVLQVIKDVAYQSRCAVFVRDNTIFLTYLSREPDSLKTLTDSDVVSGTFNFLHTATEDLVTRHHIEWSETEAEVNKDDPTDLEFVLKHNVPRYGTISKTFDYYTLNLFDLAQKTATFWMIRNANTWRLVEFQTPITHLDLDVFDCVTLDIGAFPTTKVVVMSTDYNPDQNTVTFRAWTPILSGSETEHFWAWPSQKTGGKFPLTDQPIGDGYSFSVTPPVGHPLRGAYDPDAARIQTAGDMNPSDLDDSFAQVVCRVATGAEIQDAVEPDMTPFEPVADKNFADSLDRQEELSAGTGGASESDEGDEERPCGDPPPGNGGCIYEVSIYYVTPRSITSGIAPGDNCPKAGPCNGTTGGLPCASSAHTFCHTFGSLFSAQAFRQAKAEEAQQLKENCGYAVGQTNVYLAGNITPIAGSGGGGACEDVPDAENQTGQTTTPGLESGDPDTAPDPGDL